MTFFKLKFSIISNASSKTIFQVYFYILSYFRNHTPDEKLTVEEIHRSSLWQGGHHQNFHYLVRTQFLYICPFQEYFGNLWRFFIIFFNGRSAGTCYDIKNFPGFSLLPFRFQIFHNSSPSIWSHWQTIDLQRASIFPTLVTTKNR